MRIAFQMDAVQDVDINADSTFRIAEEAQARGHALFFYLPDRMWFDAGQVWATGHEMTLRREVGNHVSLGPRQTLPLTAAGPRASAPPGRQ